MIVPPLRKVTHRPVALVSAGYRRLTVATEDGERTYDRRRDIEAALARLSGHCVFSPGGLAHLRYSTGATSWCLSAWRGKETRMTHVPTGVSVTSLRGTLEDSDDVWGDLQRVLRWLHGYGIGPASISAMSWALWRASLAGEVSIGFDPDVGRAAFYGGRQEVAPAAPDGGGREFRHMVATDIRAAYPHAMASGPSYALSLREVDPTTTIDPSIAGIATARVMVPSDLDYAPLPVRIAPAIIQFQWGLIFGTWPWCELAAAAEVGCEVTVARSYAPRREGDPFGAWWPLAQEGRDLPGASGRLAKAITNSLWGQFAMVGDGRTEVRWTDDEGEDAYAVELPNRSMPHTWCSHIAAETSGRVRTRLLTEGLFGSPVRPVHIDTDGIIVRKSAAKKSGVAFGEWRQTESMARVQVKAPQLYRYTCGHGCGVSHTKWHYKASGLTKSQAPRFFDRHGETATTISYLAEFDANLPPDHVAEIERRRALLDEAAGFGL